MSTRQQILIFASLAFISVGVGVVLSKRGGGGRTQRGVKPASAALVDPAIHDLPKLAKPRTLDNGDDKSSDEEHSPAVGPQSQTIAPVGKPSEARPIDLQGFKPI